MADANESSSRSGATDRDNYPGATMIPRERIRADELGVRSDITAESVEDLAGSISRVGLINPISVRLVGNDYVVVAGHRRFAAIQTLGWEEVPCAVCTGSDVQVRERVFAENFHRADVTPIEQACAIKDAVESGACTIEQVAGGFHRSTTWVRQQLAMLEWPDDVTAAIHAGILSVAAASNLACITDDTYREYLVRIASENGATARNTAAWLQAWQSSAPMEEAAEAEPVPPGRRVEAMVPQAPCFFCGEYSRTDALSMVPVCTGCVDQIRKSQQGL